MNTILLTKATAARNGVALNYHWVRGQHFLAVVFVVTIIEMSALKDVWLLHYKNQWNDSSSTILSYSIKIIRLLFNLKLRQYFTYDSFAKLWLLLNNKICSMLILFIIIVIIKLKVTLSVVTAKKIKYFNSNQK